MLRLNAEKLALVDTRWVRAKTSPFNSLSTGVAHRFWRAVDGAGKAFEQLHNAKFHGPVETSSDGQPQMLDNRAENRFAAMVRSGLSREF